METTFMSYVNSYDKVVMWTGGSYDYDDVMRALVRLDRPEMRPGTSGQSGKTVPTYVVDPELDAMMKGNVTT